jgi:dihydroflavonol-4-reductase
MARVYVTGGNGFIGSRVVEELARRGYQVTALVGADVDNGNLEGIDAEVRPLDVTDEREVERALEGGELLVHSAACYSFWERDPEHIYRVNVLGTRNVLRAAARQGYRKIVYTSSASTLTPAIAGRPGTEETLFDARRFGGHYKTSKLIAEMAVLRELARGLPGVIVHPTTVIGTGDRRPTPTGRIIVHFINGRMKAYAGTILSVVDVEDVAEGHVLALERGEVGHQYLLGGENCSMSEVTRMLSELTGLPAPRVMIPSRVLLALGRVDEFIATHLTRRPPLIDVESTLHARVNRAFSSAKAEKELGYRPGQARAALAKATRWFVEHGYCGEKYRRRIEAHGALTATLER